MDTTTEGATAGAITRCPRCDRGIVVSSDPPAVIEADRAEGTSEPMYFEHTSQRCRVFRDMRDAP